MPAERSVPLHLYLMAAPGADPAAQVTAALQQAGHRTWAGQVQGEPPGEPLTHFFHCWRFPGHHRCAVALIERMGEENTAAVSRAGHLENQLRDLTGDPMLAMGTGQLSALVRAAARLWESRPAGCGDMLNSLERQPLDLAVRLRRALTET